MTRILRSPKGHPFSEDAYTRLQERVADELYGRVAAEDLVIKERKENLHAIVRRQVEREFEDQYAELQATAAGLEAREDRCRERERKASPSYRAAFLTAGASLALSADLLIRLVAQ